jgi:hypothetical protein
MCFVMRNPGVTTALKCAMEILQNKYTPIATPSKGANAIKEIHNSMQFSIDDYRAGSQHYYDKSPNNLSKKLFIYR